jgi:hypothetical protein
MKKAQQLEKIHWSKDNDEHILITLPTSSLQHPTNQLLEKAIHTDDASVEPQ